MPVLRTVLIVDDDPAMRSMLAPHLTHRGHRVLCAASPADALTAAAAEPCDVVVADIHMHDGAHAGIALCRALRADHPQLPVILITAFGTLDTAIEAIRAGATDFVPKPFRIDDLAGAIARATAAPAPRATAAPPLLGASPAMIGLRRLIAKLGPSDAPVLITGASGTGKELVARALHAAGPRAAGPLVAVNCAAMPAALLESELFGHTAGAFTDARAAKPGLFAAAHGGTLFLDEIGELPLELQPKLLRALQERRVRPVGGTSEVPFDARLITATNRDLDRMVKAGTFRGDLFFRIHVVRIAVPALRDRGDDIALLAAHFLGPGRALSPAAADALVTYDWPGNVRELENCIDHAVAVADGPDIELADLPAAIAGGAVDGRPLDDGPPETLDEVERRHIARVLAGVAGNKTAAARILGIERKTLYRMLERHSGRQ